ncbi:MULTISPECIES: LysR family transcriptional regulator [unclassified Paenibacillus]|uniref:LysR family transcriptional regulator n=1 Tax=unclassified Paenibacillus TaxID=185978 RepID=UPI00363E3F18
MDSRKLHYFAEVASASSFTKASEKLLVAQPAISKTIQKLEDELQLLLFDRSEKSAILTQEGKVLFDYANDILGKMEDARRVMEEMRELQRGEIRIGLPSMFGSAYFLPIIKEFKRSYPSLNISVVEEGTKQIRTWIERKEIDFGIISANPIETEVEVIPLLNDYMVACFSADHPLADKEVVTLHELLSEPLIFFKNDCFQKKLLIEVSKKAELEMNVTFTTNQLSIIKSLVAEGVGVTMLLRMVTISNSKMSTVPIYPPIPVQLVVCKKRNTYLSKASQTFLDFLKQKAAASNTCTIIELNDPVFPFETKEVQDPSHQDSF